MKVADDGMEAANVEVSKLDAIGAIAKHAVIHRVSGVKGGR